jgi:hypothetical protein
LAHIWFFTTQRLTVAARCRQDRRSEEPVLDELGGYLDGIETAGEPDLLRTLANVLVEPTRTARAHENSAVALGRTRHSAPLRGALFACISAGYVRMVRVLLLDAIDVDAWETAT